jgi:hypothetical protein
VGGINELWTILKIDKMNLVASHDHKLNLKELILKKTGIDIDDSINQKHFLSKEYFRIFDPNNSPGYRDNLLYFNYFLCQFEKIWKYNRKDFNDYLSKLSNDGDNLYGERFEIYTYARLIDKSISFSKPKLNPDFEFNFGDSLIFIECGSRQTDKKGFFIESVEQAIENKQQQGEIQNYANLNTALHIDITTTVYNSYGDNDFLDTNVIDNILDNAIKKVDFGAIVLLQIFYGKEDGIVYGFPIFKYKDNCNDKLKYLHQMMFDLEKKQITPILKKHI